MRETVVSPGQEIELEISSVNHQGQGVGRFEGMAVFVASAVPGEKVVARITGLRKNYAEAELVNIISASKRRIVPKCPVFETCGGSHFQHIDYDYQLELKRQLVRDSIGRIGRMPDTPVKPVIGMTEPWGYRNKVHFQVNRVNGQIKLGFFAEGTYSLVPAAQCLLLDRQITDTASLVEAALNLYDVSAYDWDTGTGLMRHVVIRKGWHTSKMMIVFVTSDEEFAEQHNIARDLMSKVPEVISVMRNINTGRGRQVFGQASQLVAGESSIPDKLCGLNFSISPTSFFQVNPVQTEVLYQKALEYAGLTGNETVLDVYCGIGTISLLLAQRAQRVIGLELSQEAVLDAAQNARANGIENVEFIAGRAEDRLPGLMRRGIRPELIVVDPPRQGMEKKALQAIADMAPDKIVYISCAPATMARDLQALSQRGYKAVEVQPVDMFPQTSHTECVVYCRKKRE